MGMTHGDAITILRTSSSREEKLKALEVIFENELEYDYNCLTKPHLWALVRFMYKEIKNVDTNTK